MPRVLKRGLATLSRVFVIRLVAEGFPLLAGLGLVLAFHFEFGRKRLPPAADFGATVALALGLAALYAVLVRLLEARWPKELALRPALARLAVGLAIGFGLFSVVYAVFFVTGIAHWQGFSGFAGVAPMLLLAVVAGIGEELLFRGVLFRNLEDSLGTTVALVLSAAAFGLMHAGNPGATVASTLAIALEAGVMLAAAYAWSRSLWLPIGVHIAWNFTEAGIYAAPDSGIEGHGLLSIAVSKSASPLITGGAFGPEASLVATAICLVAGAVFILAAVRSGRWRKASFRMLLGRGAPLLNAA